MKRKFLSIVCGLLCFSCLASCGEKPAAKQVSINVDDYYTDEKIIKLADLPPNPTDSDAVKLYKDMGFNTFILTEDSVKMVDGGKVSAEYLNVIKSLKDEGFNVWVRNMYNDPDYFDCDTDKSGSNYGTPYTMEKRKITNEFTDATGFYFADEAYMKTLEDLPETEYDEKQFSAFDQFGKIIDWKNKYYPDAFAHFNHVPSSSIDHYRGYSYGEFIQNFVDNVVSKFESGGRSICLDHYPFHEGTTRIDDGYILDLLTCANICRDYNKTAPESKKAIFGLCLQTFQDVKLKLRDIKSDNDISMQMYTGMALGTRLYEYFCYRSLDGIGLYGILDSSGNKRIYDYVKTATDRTTPYEKLVNSFEWLGATAYSGKESEIKSTFDEISELVLKDTGVLKNATCRYDTLVGCFTKGEQPGYMVVNFTSPELNQNDIVTLEFENCTDVLIFTENGAKQQNLVDGKIRLNIPAGQAAFLIPA